MQYRHNWFCAEWLYVGALALTPLLSLDLSSAMRSRHGTTFMAEFREINDPSKSAIKKVEQLP
jgi:hypothetical protein